MDRVRLAGRMHALVSRDLETRGFMAAFTERVGGVSRGRFESLNLAFDTGDTSSRVAENRRRTVQALGCAPFATARQVHGTRVLPVGRGRAGRGFARADRELESADALAVTRPSAPVAILVADCVPLALGSPTEERLVVVHAGWRGIAGGLVERSAGVFERPAEVWAAIGPAIGSCHYEVGPDVVGALSGGSSRPTLARRRGRLYVDLAATVARRLRTAGVKRIEESGVCTACLNDRFFSYRRDGGTGRQALIGVRL
ncbi:MAG: polyphenol oxidase family protein [Actinomycetota bacterium]